jgi:hypothetical protein
MFGMRKGLKYIKVVGTIQSMQEDYKHVVIRDEAGQEIKDALNKSKPVGLASRQFSNGENSRATFQSCAVSCAHWPGF